MTTKRGTSHEMEPEVDSLSFIDFEGDDYREAAESDDPKDLENWYVEAAVAFLGEAEVIDHEASKDTTWLYEEYQCRGAELFWAWVIDQALTAGFDVYDSDTRTELFPPSPDKPRADALLEQIDGLSPEALAILAEAVQGLSPAGWGIPTSFEDDGWSSEQYRTAWNEASDFVSFLANS